MSEELKPCPKCKSKNVKFGFAFKGFGNFGIWCEDCGFMLHEIPIQSKEEMVEAWNRRADDGRKNED